MSSSLSTMPFSRQYGSFRMAGPGNNNTASGTCSPGAGNHRVPHGGINQASRHSTGTETGGQVASGARLQMAPLNYRIGNLARNSSNNWISNSSNTTSFAAIRQQKISSQQQHQQHHQEHSSGRPAVSKQQPPATCAVHRATGPAAKKMGEPIGDSPLLQSPRIIARSARIVEPNAWNRRLTTSNFCTMASAAASQSQHTGNRLLQTSLACRKSPGSSGTSVESIVPKYSRSSGAANGTGGAADGAGGVEATTAQKRTYNAQKPQMRVVSSRTLTNTTGRVGGGTVAKKATGSGVTGSGSVASQDAAEREVAKVLHHHNMRVIDLLNNNHLQTTRSTNGRVIKENNENHQPAVLLTSNGGQKLSGTKTKGSAIPQRLPLADRDQPIDRNRRLLLGECFSSKFPNGLPFEQEFYYRRSGQDTDTAQPFNEVEQDVEKELVEVEEDEDARNRIVDAYERHRKSKKHPLLPRRQGGGVMLAGRRVAMTQQDLQRSRSVSSSDEATPPATTSPTDERRSVSAIEREHDDEDALYVDFTKVHDPQSVDHPVEDEEPDDGQTSVVEYRNINHSSYYYKFESISTGGIHRKEQARRKLLQRRPGDAGGDGRPEVVMRSRYQRSRLGLDRAGGSKPDANGNTGREYYDDDEERVQCRGDPEEQMEEYEEEEDGEDGEEDEEEGERSTVYVAVATWVPKCNRLPNESSETSNTISLTLSTNNGNNDAIDQHQQQHQQPTRIAVAGNTTTNTTPAVGPAHRTGLPVPAPSTYVQL
uniref:Uncharacterized protein n=1 Tax=Anopheles maculatus TaxID=74869 RepID=A0A182SJJ3_9DIPT